MSPYEDQSMSECHICGAQLEDDEESLHYNCGGDCLWCMARSGDPECQARVQGMFMRDCIDQMNAAVDEFETEMEHVGLSGEEFRLRLLEQWRPW